MPTGFPAVALAALVTLALAAPASGTGVELDALGTTVAPISDAIPAGARVTYNRFGTPGSLINDHGVLAANVAGADPVARARTFLTDNRVLFGLSADDVAGLQVVHDIPLGEHGRSVLLRQR